MKTFYYSLLMCFLSSPFYAQKTPMLSDTTQVNTLEEMLIIAKKKKIETEMKMAVSVDEYLASSDQISFIKRGAYAWEPLLNNMSSERSKITIDGMHIFGACTDKMDPITAYVESNNLAEIDIKSGQEGSMHGATVSGSINLKRKNTLFSDYGSEWKGTYQTGYEFNNKQFFNLGNLSFASDKFVADASVAYRKASNYTDGKDNEVKHSQYKKFNTSLGLAYKTSPLSALRFDAIFDVAKDVGYPALPMDLWLSRALITSVSYKKLFEEGLLRVWDTKLYFNTIEHYMDDTTRPENLVHMDMPGWSTTFGLTSKANLRKENLSSEIQVNAYQNIAIAEMRMYPQDRSERTMFAYSWPWVTTRYAGVSLGNSWDISPISQLNFGGSLGLNYNHSKYIDFNWIFYPGAPQEKTRFLPSIYTNYTLFANKFNVTIGGGYGQRAPSVSEAYGYYIYNSFDRYDYVGNPNLKNETSYELNASAGFKTENLNLSAKVNYFYIKDYIIGEILSLGSPMNYQSVGVKGYTALSYAEIVNFSLNGSYKITPNLQWKGNLTYVRGKDDKGGNLPFIRPLSYQTAFVYNYKKLSVQTSLNGDLEQVDYSPKYGEDNTPAYKIWNLSANYAFYIKNNKFIFQIGAENVLNEYYSTYADWGNIPRMGRNVFTSLKIDF
ncbi:iron complex outermembrane receptor protein [Mesonia hippocampi]|uniref:Iron complex outermembrane receptor protein n=2 Tax=Mesonia hippocampi TaxID=1628250 RepID=A0A840ER44_9FLAO|nr:iron complex outermembrane receptor protein [Mesonia hippocampi]